MMAATSGQHRQAGYFDARVAAQLRERFVFDNDDENLKRTHDALFIGPTRPPHLQVVKPASATAVPAKPSAPSSKATRGHHAADVVLLNGANVTPEAVSWLWPGFLACGKFHINAGAPGTGKTTLALSLAAIITSGGRWPDGTRALRGDVAVWSGEDDPADTLAPRLLADGADMKRVHFVSATIGADGERRPFDPATDTAHLARALADKGVKLLIVDPVVSAVAGDSHKGAETRRSLQPLVDLAAKLDCAVLGISHFSKGTQGRDPVERVTGSIAFGALARVVFATAKAADDDAIADDCDRLFVRSKSNIGIDGGGFRYALEQVEITGYAGLFASRVRWGSALEGEARTLLAAAEVIADDGDGEGVVAVAEWLRELVSDEGGKIDRRDVMRAANAMGYKERTVHRAREKLGLLPLAHGFGKDKRSIWTWPNPANSASIVPIMPTLKGGTHGTNGGTHAESDSECPF
jgi:putative DNA primase/helicase